MARITVFLGKDGRPLGSCPAGQEEEWLNPQKGEKKPEVAFQVEATDDEWHAWAKRNAEAGKIGPCLPWR